MHGVRVDVGWRISFFGNSVLALVPFLNRQLGKVLRPSGPIDFKM